MKTELININNIPNEKELVSLLGNSSYKYYHIISKSIDSLLSPELDIWDSAGRRGKYFHGYRIGTSNTLIDLYLSDNRLNCEFNLQKNSLNKIIQRKEFLSKQTQNVINSATDAMEKYGGFYLNLIINEESIADVIYILTIIS